MYNETKHINFSAIDWLILGLYIVIIIGVGLWVSRTKKGQQKNTSDYFLASKSLPFWAVGASLIASNISAEQLIGMSGSGYVIGLGIAIYEWIGAIGLILLGKFFLPVYLDKKIYTMPQFLEQRYDNRVRTSLAVFWIGLYIFVNLTSVIFLGALSLNTILNVPLWLGVLFLAAFSAIYSLYGGLKAVAWTDVIQVVILIFGGLVTTFMALKAFNSSIGETGIINGFANLLEKVPEKFDLILDKSHPSYKNLPGISVLLGGMWVINLNYWCFNQYITQRSLAAKNLKEAQRGTMFAAYLKFLIPVLVVVPGIIAFVLTKNSLHETPDAAYPWLLSNFVPVGIKGLTFAALIAAIVSSLSSMVNSTSTIFTMDIYKAHIKQSANEKELVFVGRLTSAVALIIATLIAPMLKNFGQVFQFIQEFTGWVSPGIVCIFLFGLFWKKANANAALWVAILTIPLAVLFKILFPDIPWLDSMGIIFLILCAVMILISKLDENRKQKNAIDINRKLFKTGPVFNIGAIGIFLIMAILYYFLW